MWWRTADGRPKETTALKPSEQAKLPMPTIKDIIEELGFGHGQRIMVAVACGSFLTEGLELMLLSLLGSSITRDLGVAAAHQDILVSSIFIGALAGNLISGPIADLAGRQFLVLLAYVLVAFFGVVGSFMNSMASISVLQLLVGLGFGLGQPAALTLVREVVPEDSRLTGAFYSSLFFCMGALLAVILVLLEDAWLEELSVIEWRLLLRCGALPAAILGLLATFLLPESPAFLAANNDHALARDALLALRRRNGRPGAAVRCFRAVQEEPEASASHLLCAPQPLKTLWFCAVAAVQHFALVGAGYGVPRALERALPAHIQPVAPASVLLVALALSALVLIAAVHCGGSHAHCKGGLMLSLTVSIASAVVFSWAAGFPHPGPSHRVLLVLACLGLCSGPACSLLCLVQASTSLFPALKGSTGVAACLAVGRLGAIAAPFVYDSLAASPKDWRMFFGTTVLLEFACLLCLLPLRLYAPETRDSAAAP